MAATVASRLHPVPSDLAEYAHEESNSVNRHAPLSPAQRQPAPSTAILLPHTPEPLNNSLTAATAAATPPNPTYHQHATHTPIPARPVPHPSFLATGSQPCPVEWQVRPRRAAPSTPSMAAFDPLTMSERVHNADMGEQKHKRRLLTGCAALTAFTALLLVAFAAGVYYLVVGRDVRLGDGAVAGGMLADGSVTVGKLGVGAVTNGSLSGALYATLLMLNRSYAASLEWMPTAGVGLWRSQWNPAVLNVNVNGSALSVVNNSVTIPAAAIRTQYIANSAVTAAAVARAAATAAALQPASVTMPALAADLAGQLHQINATAVAALADVVVGGTGMLVGAGSAVSVAVDGRYVVVGGGVMGVAAGSLNAGVFGLGAVNGSSLGADVLAVIPTAGAGLYHPSASRGALSINVDNSSLVLNNGTLSIGRISAPELSAGSVGAQHLSSNVATFLSYLNDTASEAFLTSVELSLMQELLQEELLAVLGLPQSEYQQLGLLSSSQLLAAIAHINTTAFAAVGQLNLSAYALSTRLLTEAEQLEAALQAAVVRVEAALPVAGYGLAEAGARLSVAVDGLYTGVVDGRVTILNGSIDTAALADGAVTGSKLAAVSVTSPILAAGSVSVDKLTSDLSSVLGMLATVDSSTISVGYANSSTTITRPAGGDLLLQAAADGDISLSGSTASTNVLSLSRSGNVTIETAGLTVAADGVSLSASSIRSWANGLALTTPLSSVVAANSSISTNAVSTTLSAPSLSLVGTSNTTIAAAHVAITSTVQATPSTMALTPLNTNGSITIDFNSLATSSIRLTGSVSSAALNVSFTGCSFVTAGRSVTLFNQLTSAATLNVPAASCSRYNDLTLPYPATVTVTCTGTQWECTQSERPQGGLALPFSTQTILSNTQSGVVATTTPIGLIQLRFTPLDNNSPFLAFTLTSPILRTPTTPTAPAASRTVHLTALSSGTTNEDYGTPGRETPVWLCASQAVNSTAGSVHVTMVNVGDPLYTLQVQTVAFVYSIV